MTTQEKLIESKLNLLDAGVFAGHGLVLRREVGSRLALRAGHFGADQAAPHGQLLTSCDVLAPGEAVA